jgi:hypothetical protein
MSLTNAVVKAGATSLTVVGGADETFTPDGVTVANGLHIADAAQADFRIRKNMSIKNRVPTLQTDGTYTKDKKSITIVAPKLLASGATAFNLVRVEREVHPESTAAEAFELNMLLGQALSDADFTAFWTSGSLL